MGSPYREMALPEPPRPDLLHRLLAAVTPERIGARWPWYRWTIGGRWSRLGNFLACPSLDDDAAFQWQRVPRCPGRLHAALLGGEPVPHGVCVDYSEALLMVDEEVGMTPPPLDGVCHCEVRRG